MTEQLTTAVPSAALFPDDVAQRLVTDAAAVVARYPEPRSALLPLLHLIQSVDSFVSPRGVAFCAETLGLSRAEVSAVATFYSQYKRKPNGRYTVGVCTNTLCAVMGGDEIYDAVSEHLGIGHDETSEDGAITLEKIECNAACDYAPVVMVNWEFFDNVTPDSATELVDALTAGREVRASRGPVVQDFRAVSRVLAGFEDGLVDDGPAAGAATLEGLRLSRAHDWRAPAYPAAEGTPGTGDDATAATGDEPEVGEVGSSAEHAEPVGENESTGEDLAERAADDAGTGASGTDAAGTDEKGTTA